MGEGLHQLAYADYQLWLTAALNVQNHRHLRWKKTSAGELDKLLGRSMACCRL